MGISPPDSFSFRFSLSFSFSFHFHFCSSSTTSGDIFYCSGSRQSNHSSSLWKHYSFSSYSTVIWKKLFGSSSCARIESDLHSCSWTCSTFASCVFCVFLLQETVEFESYMLPEENNIAFPGHVTEDSLGVSQVAIDVDAALEAVEGKHTGTELSSSSVTDYVEPRLSTKLWERVFLFTKPHAWNQLPHQLHSISHSAAFKNTLKHIFLILRLSNFLSYLF